MEEQLTNALVAAAQADKEAERFLDELCNTKFGELVSLLSQEIANEAKPFPSRQMACLYLKNTLSAKSSALQKEKHERWKALPADIRAPIKNNLLMAMRSTSQPQLPHFGAVAAAEVAAVELPYNEWPTFVPTLMEYVTGNNGANANAALVPVQMASLECLGYACERIVDIEELVGNIPDLQTKIVDDMLTTIVDAVQPSRPEDLRFAALQALRNSLLFIRKNMEKKTERDFIMGAICEAAKNSTQSRVRKLAFDCFDNISEYYYEMLQDYMTNIFQLTTEAIQKDPEEDVKLAAIEVWNTIAMMEDTLIKEEREANEIGIPMRRQACPRYVQAAMEHLVPLLLQTLTQQSEDDDEDEATLQSAGATCLENMSQAVGGLMVPFIIPYVQQHIRSPEWRFRDAAIVAFSSILEGPTREEMSQYVTQSLEVMLQAMGDQHPIVRHSAVNCVGRMCKDHYASMPPDAIKAILEAADSKLSDRPSIASQACSVIFNVAQGTKDMTGDSVASNVLSQLMVKLIQHLLAVSDRKDGNEHNIRIMAMLAASELIAASAADMQDVLRELLPAIVGRLESVMAMQVVSAEDRDLKEQLISHLAALLQSLYQRMTKEAVLSSTDKVMELLLQLLHMRNSSCHEEAFMAIGSVCCCVEEDFMKYMQAYVPLLLQGLKSFENKSLCLTTVGSVVDLCSSLGPHMQGYSDQIMEALFAIVREGSVHRDVKPRVIALFGDVALAIGSGYQPYMQLTMMLLMQASQQQAPVNNDEMIAFINDLRFSVLEAYGGILVGLAEANALQLFLPNLGTILAFLTFLASDTTKDEGVLEKAITLLGDIARELGTRPDVKQQINQPFVGQLIREALTSSRQNVKDVATWAGSIIEQAIKSG